jgi:nucleotide-binding universal stress UspA family protein
MSRKIKKDELLESFSKSGKAGLVGATLDGFMGVAHALKLYRLGVIEEKDAWKHAGNEALCGFASSTAGTLGTTVAVLALGSMGPAALAVGMGATVGARYLYRSSFPSDLPDMEEIEKPLAQQDQAKLKDLMEKVGVPEEDVPTSKAQEVVQETREPSEVEKLRELMSVKTLKPSIGIKWAEVIRQSRPTSNDDDNEG